MTTTSTATVTFHNLIWKSRPAHRAPMTAETALANLETKAGLRPQPKRGAHWAPLTGAAAWLAEEAAQIREIIRSGARDV